MQHSSTSTILYTHASLHTLTPPTPHGDDRNADGGYDASSPTGYAAQLDGYARQGPHFLPSPLPQQPGPPHMLPPLGSHPGLSVGMQGLNVPMLGGLAVHHNQQQQLWQQPGGNGLGLHAVGVNPAGYGSQQALPSGLLQSQGAGSAAGLAGAAAHAGGARGRGKHVPSPLRQRP
eukprot:scaffold55774_cov15-Tisochrysis_lutea.AAC.1